MASLHKRSNGRWKVAYRDPEGGQRSKTFRTKRAADRFKVHVEESIEEGSWRDPNEGRRTFGEIAESWLAEKTRLKPVTVTNYRGVLDARVLPTFGDVPVKSITTPHVRAWVAAMRDEGVRETTIALAFRLAGQVFELALEGGAVVASPMPRRNRPTAPKADDPMFITAEQVDQLAAAIDPHYRCWVYLMANTGLRWSEAAGLRVKRLDLMQAKLTVAEQLVDVNGKLIAQTPKTDSGRRTIGMPRWLVAMLTVQTAGKGPDDLVFTTEAQGGPLRKSNFRQRVWSPAIASAGLDGLVVHDLRHSHVAQLLAEGWDPVAISERLGHSDAKFTMSRYGHVRPDHRQTLVDRLEAYAPQPLQSAVVANIADAHS